MKSGIEVFFIFLRLGLTSFGGPIAHLSYFHDEFVNKRKWFDEHAYADLVSLCQFLPGPASSQVGIAIGLSRAGLPGSIAAWLGFTLPSAMIMVAFAFGISIYAESLSAGWLHGLKIVAVAIVAQAIWGMGTKLCHDKPRATIAFLSAALVLSFSSSWVQILVMMAGGLSGIIFLEKSTALPPVSIAAKLSQRMALVSLTLFAFLLVFLPMAVRNTNSHGLQLFDSFFRAGSLVFGGGHVVLPLLKAELVNAGWVSADAFMAGYGAAQAIPGPLFTFSAYLGAVSSFSPTGVLGAIMCLVAAFLPSFLLVYGVLPFWENLRQFPKMRLAMSGINASVVGLLLAAFYDPVWTSGILNSKDFAIAALGFLALTFWKTQSWGVVILSALAGWLWL